MSESDKPRAPSPEAQKVEGTTYVEWNAMEAAAPATKDGRLSLRLSPEARAAVEKIKELGNMDSLQEAIRRAIGEELFLLTERRAGWKVLLQKGDRYREVIFPQI